ncbi:MAG: TIGR00730 family Rossman fold protein [Pseudomonadota bacterium]
MATLRSLCVYCGSRLGDEPRYKEAAETLGTALAKEKVRLVFGGGKQGLMGVTAETVRDAGGEVLGIIPNFLTETEGAVDGIELIRVETMHERKDIMFHQCDAVCVLPGGIGTLEETIEVLSWASLKLHKKPIIICNIGGYWDPLVTLIDHILDDGFGYPGLREDITVVTCADDVIPAARRQMKTNEEA